MLQNLFTSINSFRSVSVNARLSLMCNLTPQWAEKFLLCPQKCALFLPVVMSASTCTSLQPGEVKPLEVSRDNTLRRCYVPLQGFLKYVRLFFLLKGSEKKHLSRFEQCFCYFSEGRETSVCWFCIPEINLSTAVSHLMYVTHLYFGTDRKLL